MRTGEGVLENVQLRADAFDYLQLPFVVRHGSVGKLKLQVTSTKTRRVALFAAAVAVPGACCHAVRRPAAAAMQIPWGHWRGGALVVELEDVVLCVSSREEVDWEEAPALRRAQAAKQAALAAAEIAKLGSRVAASGNNRGGPQQPSPAAIGANTTGSSGGSWGWGWSILEYISTYILNRLHFQVTNVHLFFEV
jgi:N-terminal region of Chorein or VPS13